MDRYVLVSSDGHAGPPWEVLKGYLERSFYDDFDRWVTGWVNQQAPFYRSMEDARGEADRTRQTNEQAVKEGGRDGAWDPVIRKRELDREGVAAEIMFHDGQNRNTVPFGMWGITGGSYFSFKHHWAAAKAHNRWMAEFCATDPTRHYGCALILPQDVEAAVVEMHRARKAGLRGIELPGLSMLTNDPEAFWHHPRHEPIWSACEELGMPLQIHVGAEMPNYGFAPGARWINSMEVFWTTRRPVWHLIWGGVMERHPGLKLSITESGGSWAPAMLELMEYLYDVRNPAAARALLPLRPSEYWRRQCAIGVSPPAGRSVVEMRDAIGLETIMWGSDYPHHEGTWPRSNQRLRDMFSDIPLNDVRKMVGENAARHCGMDLKQLETIAARIGPSVTEFGRV